MMDYEENHNKLIYAILSGCAEKALLKKLIENVKDPKLFVEGTKGKSMSPMGACIVCDNMKLLDTLLLHGAPVDFTGSGFCKYKVLSPVHMAIKSQRPDILQKLLKAGASCSQYHVYRAMFFSDKELLCFKTLMKHISDKNIIVYSDERDNLEFSRLFHVALDYQQGMHIGWENDELYEDFKLSEDADADEVSEDADADVRLVDILIKSGFCLDTVVMTWRRNFFKEEGSWCPLELAIMNQNCMAAVLLIKAGCAINSTNFYDCEPDEGSRIFQYCIIYRTFELIQILVLAGVKITTKHMESIQKILNGENIKTYRYHDCYKKPSLELVQWLTKEDSNPASLQRICRVIIRRHLSEMTKGCTILPSIEQLEIPQLTKAFLALEIL